MPARSTNARAEAPPVTLVTPEELRLANTGVKTRPDSERGRYSPRKLVQAVHHLVVAPRASLLDALQDDDMLVVWVQVRVCREGCWLVCTGFPISEGSVKL